MGRVLETASGRGPDGPAERSFRSLIEFGSPDQPWGFLQSCCVLQLTSLQRGGPTDHVFLSARGRPYGDTRTYKLPGGNPLRKAHDTACRRAGVQNFTVHDWRHHWASWCVMSGIDLPTIQRMGGWAGLRMVERYVALSTDHMAEAIRRIA